MPTDIGSRGPAPLLVALHGCHQTASDFATGTRFDEVAARDGVVVVYPEQGHAANSSGCWNWFLPQHQTRDAGEPAAILRLIEEIADRYPIDRGLVFVAGLSAGGSMAAILGEQAPDVFAGVGIMAGVALHASHDMPSAFAAMSGKRATVRPAPEQAGLRIEGSRSARLHPLVAELQAGLRPVLSGLPSGLSAAPPTSDRIPTRRPADFAKMRVMVWTGSNDNTVAPANAVALAEQYAALLGLDAARADRYGAGAVEVRRWRDDASRSRVELWDVPNMGHAWSGGSPHGSFTYPPGPNASDIMLAYFLRR